MKKVLLIAVLIVAVLGMCAGCTANKQFVDGVDGYTKVVLPEYKAYVQADPKLDADSKRIRVQTADKLQALVDEAKKQNEDSK